MAAEKRVSKCIGSGRWICTTDLRVMSPASFCCSIPQRVGYRMVGTSTVVMPHPIFPCEGSVPLKACEVVMSLS